MIGTTLKHEHINSIYAFLKQKAIYYFKNKKYKKAIDYFDKCAILMHSINTIYYDSDIESTLIEISRKLIQRSKPNLPVQNKFVFYDQIGSDKVLSIQYIKALISADVDFLYVLDKGRHTDANEILNILKTYSKAKVLEIPYKLDEKLQQVQVIHDKIIDYCPSKIFIISPAEGAFGCLLISSLYGIERIRIVPGDHHFYLGVDCVDRFIEFRDFGKAIARQKRHIANDKLLTLQFYPIIPQSSFFIGFPKECKGKIKIYSGGASYKISGYNNIFINLLKQILNLSENIVFLYSGSPSLQLQKLASYDKYRGKIFFLGYRKDIVEVIRHIDIFMGTTPVIGGLMAQYSSILQKPILQYEPSELYQTSKHGVDSIVQREDGSIIAYTDNNDFINYARKLIEDIDFRQCEGIRNNGAVISENIFNKSFSEILSNKYHQKDEIMVIPEAYFSSNVNQMLESADYYTFVFDLFVFRDMLLYIYKFPIFINRALFRSDVRSALLKSIKAKIKNKMKIK